jgi:hypothetical protein
MMEPEKGCVPIAQGSPTLDSAAWELPIDCRSYTKLENGSCPISQGAVTRVARLFNDIR